jgi:FAD:protein FMN transferase
MQRPIRRAVLIIGISACLAFALWLSRSGSEQSASDGASPPSAGDTAQAEQSKRPSAPPPTGDPAASELALHRLERRMMGTVWAMTIAGGDAEAARAAMGRALDEVGRLEAILSEWRPDSEISAVNRAAGEAPVKVGPELMACVKASLEIARWSDGAFDVSWAALRDLWDFGPDSRRVPPTKEQVKARLPLWNWRNIRVDEKRSSVFLVRRGMQIGLGGIAKGYAADRAGEILLAAGFDDFLIFAGGQVLVHGQRGDRPWRVGIQHPRKPSYFGFVEVNQGSVATSGDYEHGFEYAGRRYHHIIDPKTGFPSDATASVTVVAPTALWADAVDTAVFILGPQRGLSALKRAPGGPYEAAIVAPDMTLSTTPGLTSRLLLRAHVGPDRRLGEPLAPNQPAETLNDAPH